MTNLFQSPTYPGGKNNNPNSTNQPFRDLSLINQPAGFLEFSNTEGNEMLTLGHHSGGMLQFNKYYAGLLAPRGFKSHILGNSFQQINGHSTIQADKGMDFIQLGDSFDKTGDIDKWQAPSEEYLRQIKPIHDKKRLFEIKRVGYKNFIDQAPDQKKSGKLAPCPTESYESTHIYTVSPTIYIPGQYIPCSSTQILQIQQPEIQYDRKTSGGGKMFDGWYCLTCWGTGDSPSSQDGEWDKEELKEEIEDEYAKLSESLIETEKMFGQNSNPEGGNKIVKVGKSKVEIIGTAFNSMESFRIDPTGKLVQFGVKIDPFGGGLYIQHRESPLVETVHVDPGIGGDLVQTIGDRWAVNVGSNGIHFKTSGQFNIFGSIMNIIGETITIHTRNEICIGSQRVDIEGEIITLRPKPTKRKIEDASGEYANLPANGKDETEQERQVLVDGNLNVAQNTIIKGGAHIEGELTVQHITAPLEYHITETDFETNGMEGDCMDVQKTATKGDLVGGMLIGYVVNDLVYSYCVPNAVNVHPHYHYFKNIPLRLFRDSVPFEVTIGGTTDQKDLLPHDAVRAIGARNNFDKPVLAKPVYHSETNNTVIEKFGGSSCGESLVIVDGSWEETLEEDKLPDGEGVASEKYKQNNLKENRQKLDEKIEGRYKDNKELVENVTQNTKEARIHQKGINADKKGGQMKKSELLSKSQEYKSKQSIS